MFAMIRVAMTVLVIASGFALASCDTLDSIELFDTKKKLQGERKPVFPEGVPGIERGIPKEYIQGYQPQQDEPSAATDAAAAETPKAKPAKAANPKRTAQAKPQRRQQPQQQPAEAPDQQPAAEQQPAAQQSQGLDQRWPDAPSPGRFSR